MIFSGLRPLVKMVLKALTNERPGFFQRNHPDIFGKHINAHQQVAVAVVKFSHRLHISQIHLPLLVNTAYDHRFLLKRRGMGLWRVYASCFINHSLIFVWLILNVPFFTSLYNRSTSPNPPKRFGS